MKQSEKQRLITRTREAVAQMKVGHSKVKEYAEKAAAGFSPTNADRYRTLAEIVWWLIAADAGDDAIALLDALCEVDEEYYWMFHALSSVFATRAWLREKRKEASAQEDAQRARQWIYRDPNAKAITETEIRNALKRFDGFVADATRARGTITALHTFSHALRCLVMYQQCAIAGDPAAKTIQPDEFSTRMDIGVRELRRRIEAW